VPITITAMTGMIARIGVGAMVAGLSIVAPSSGDDHQRHEPARICTRTLAAHGVRAVWIEPCRLNFN
jgi:hypothetical protein